MCAACYERCSSSSRGGIRARELGKLDQVLAEVQEELLAPLSAAERKQLIRLLTRLLERDPAEAAGDSRAHAAAR
jgi:DNA-binding MarR family transcriptional regulator